jgi:hypothetical protein
MGDGTEDGDAPLVKWSDGDARPADADAAVGVVAIAKGGTNEP